MMTGLEDNKEVVEEILNFLSKGDKEKSTSEICGRLSRNYYFILNILEEMERKGIIESIKIKDYIFWKLKEKR